jgi:hypothetical protein
MKILWPIHFLAGIALLVMFPTAIAAWYSNCFNVPLSYGFGLILTSIVMNIIVIGLMQEIPIEDKSGGNIYKKPISGKQYVHTTISAFIEGTWSLAMSSLIIYGVYLQFKGRCNLSRR